MLSYRILFPVISVNVKQNVGVFRSMSSSKKLCINYNSKHLKAGDPLTSWNGKLRVYNMRYCPYAQRLLLALIAKNADFEVVNVDLMNKPEWLKSKSPFGKVPSLEISENKYITESLITSEYVDEIFPQRPLLPKDPFRKATDKIIAEMSAHIHTVFFKVLKNLDITEANVNDFKSALKYIENELTKRGTTFLHGNEPGYADYMIWPWFERLPSAVEFNSILKINEKEFPVLVQYIKNMERDPVVIEYMIPADIHKQYFRHYQTGNIDYELLNK